VKTCVAVWFLTLCGNPGLPVDAREVLPPSSFAAGPVSEQEDPPESGSADNDGTPGDGERVYGTYRLIDWQARLSSLDPKSTEALDSIPALIAIISDARLPADVRRPFAVTLGRIGVPARDAIPVLDRADRAATPVEGADLHRGRHARWASSGTTLGKRLPR